MTAKLFGRALGGLLLAWGGAAAADFATPSTALPQPQVQPPASAQPPASGASGQPPPAASGQMAAALAAPRAPAEVEEARAWSNPRMMGDFPALFALRTILVPARQNTLTILNVQQTTLVTVNNGTLGQSTFRITTTSQVPVQQQATVAVPVTVRVPFPFLGDFNVAENESARPEDRVFFNYNFYSKLAGPGTSAGLPRLSTTSTAVGNNTVGTTVTPVIPLNLAAVADPTSTAIVGSSTTVTTLTPGVPAPRIDLHREVVGFEKTFLGGDASVELRAPVVEQEGADAIGGSDFGDVTVLLKYAILNDRQSGDVLSAGLAVTLPTGPDIPLQNGEMHPTLLQPFAAYVWNCDRLFVQGFSSVVFPTDWRDVVLLFNDVGVGYGLYRSAEGGFIRAVVPTLEAHLTTPLNHRDANSPITVPDLLVLTAGTHIEMSGGATLSVGVATPLTGPRVFDVEALVQLNWRF